MLAFRKTLRFSLPVLLASFVMLACQKAGPEPRARAGILDLSAYDFESDGPLELNGEWSFYWREFQSAERAGGPPGQSPKGDGRPAPIQAMPGHWKIGHEDDASRTDTGFATYRLKILLPPGDRTYAFRLDWIVSAHRLFLDGELIGQVGEIATRSADERIERRPYLVRRRMAGGEHEVVVHVSNFNFRRGGMLDPIVFGLESDLRDLREDAFSLELFLVGSVLVMALYHLVLAIQRPADRSLGFFSAFCFIIVMRSLVTGESMLLHRFPEFPFELTFKMDVAGYFLAVAVFVAFVRELFPEDCPRLLSRGIVAVGFVFGLLALVFPVSISNRLLDPFHVFTLFAGVFVLGVMVLAVARQRSGARMFLIGLAALAATAVYDILEAMGVFEAAPINLGGLLVFTFFQAVVLSRRVARAFADSEALSEKLEERVQERTEQLEKSEVELAQLNEFSRQINQNADFDAVLGDILDYFHGELDVEIALVFLKNEQTNSLQARTASIPAGEYPTKSMREYAVNLEVPLEEESGVIYQAFLRKRPLFIPRLDPRLMARGSSRTEEIARELELKSFLLVPLVVDDEALGMIMFTAYLTPFKPKKAEIKRIARACEQIAGAVHTTSLLAEVQRERARSDELLNRILPATTALELKEKGEVTPVQYESATVMFVDFVGFTAVARYMSPAELVDELNLIFRQFDQICIKNEIEKIKTIGDAYMCAGGLPVANRTHAVDVCMAALHFKKLVEDVRSLRRKSNQDFWNVRIGIHTGPLVAGVIGINKFAYDLWGDTVNVASRVESTGVPGEIIISEQTHSAVADFFASEFRAEVDAKNRGKLRTYTLAGLRPEYSIDGDGMRYNAICNEHYQKLKSGRWAPDRDV